MKRFSHSCLVALALLLSGCTAVERLAIPASRLASPSYQQTGQTAQVNHQLLDYFLARYLVPGSDGIARVDYSAVSKEDYAALDRYIAQLTTIDAATLTSNAQLAYWINLYNAKTISVVLAHYPVGSIREIKDGFFDLGPWEDKRLTIGHTELSLHDIEHQIIRPIWHDDPRIHYALNCAAVGCPNLAERAYRADTVDDMLNQAAIAYVNHPRGANVDPSGRLTISKIYAWYLDDFGGSEASILAHLRRYANVQTQSKLADKTTIDRYEYDWSLNDAAAAE